MNKMQSASDLNLAQPVPDQAHALEHYANGRSVSRAGVWLLLLGLSGSLAWAGFAPLDEGVPTDGTVSIETNHRVVQHLTGGMVSKILVREGQEVRQGDVLLTLDEQNTRARFEEVRQRYLGLRAQESRLMAEKSGLATIRFHDDLLQHQDDPLIRQHMLNQTQLLQARRAALSADVAAKRESIAGQKALIDGYRGMLESQRAQLALLQEQLSSIRDLVRDGYAPRVQQNELEQKVALLQGQIAGVQGDLLRSQKMILELNQQIVIRQQSEQKEIDTDMAQVKLQVEADAEKFKALTEDLGRTLLRAPASGQVVGLQVHTVGAVIQPGQNVMDIVPMDEPLIIDARIQPHLIDKVHAGQTADVRFATFADAPQLLAEGKLVSISRDLVTSQGGGEIQPSSYYLARISLTAKGMQSLGGRRLQPGMPVQVVIKTGERSLLTYWLHPFTKRIAASMKEE